MAEAEVKGGLLGQDVKRFQFKLPAAEMDMAKRIVEEAGYANMHAWFRDQIERTRQDMQAKEGGTLTPTEMLKMGVGTQRPGTGGSTFDRLMDMVNKRFEAEMTLQLLNSLNSGPTTPQSKTADPEYLELKRQERELMAMDRQRQEEASLLRLAMMSNMFGGGNQGGDNNQVQALLQQMQEDRREAERRWEEFFRRQEEKEREKQQQEYMEAMKQDNEYLQQELLQEKERRAEELLRVRDELEAKMKEQMDKISLGHARETQDEFTKTLETYSKVNQMIDAIAPNLGYRKSPSLGSAMAGAAGKAGAAAKPSKTASVSEAIATATGLVAEVRALLNDGVQLTKEAQSAQPTPAPVVPGMPTIPQGPPVPVTQPSVPQIKPPIGRREKPEEQPKRIPSLPKGTPVADGSDIDPELRGLKTSKGAPLSDRTLREFTRLRRDGKGVASIEVCEDHGEMMPCPVCEAAKPAPAPDTGPARPEPPTNSTPTRETCPVCGNPLNAEGQCDVCLGQLVSVTQQYNALVNDLNSRGVDTSDVAEAVDSAREKALVLDYIGAKGDLEAAAERIVRKYEALQSQEQQAPTPEPEQYAAEQVAEMEREEHSPVARDAPVASEPVMEDTAHVEPAADALAQLEADGALLREITEAGVDVGPEVEQYTEAITKYEAGDLAAATEQSRAAASTAKAKLDALNEAFRAEAGALSSPQESESEPEPEPGTEPGVGKNDQAPPIAMPPEEPKAIIPPVNPDFELYPGVNVPPGAGPIVGVKGGPMGRLIEVTDDKMTVDTVAGTVEVSPDQLRAGVCQYCGRDCHSKGGRASHERVCAKRYYGTKE